MDQITELRQVNVVRKCSIAAFLRRTSSLLTFRSQAGLLAVLVIYCNCVVEIGIIAGTRLTKERGSVLDNEARLQSERLDSYWRDLRQGGDFNLRSATRLIYENTTHSDDRRISFTENWIQWLIGQFYDPLLQTQDTSRIIRGNQTNC